QLPDRFKSLDVSVIFLKISTSILNLPSPSFWGFSRNSTHYVPLNLGRFTKAISKRLGIVGISRPGHALFWTVSGYTTSILTVKSKAYLAVKQCLLRLPDYSRTSTKSCCLMNRQTTLTGRPARNFTMSLLHGVEILSS